MPIQIKVVSLKTTQSQTSIDPHAKKTLLTCFTLILTNQQNPIGSSKFFQVYKLEDINCSNRFYHILGVLAL